jgi:DNA helicase-2/ATP-dependent DNA helicase PcrA
MREIASDHYLEYRDENEFLGNLIAEVSKVKNERIALADFNSAQCGEEEFRKIFAEYDHRLRQNRLIDFDDMLLYTYELFSQRKDILAAWQNKYRYILIDEFQDINQLQFDIVKLMAEPQNNLFVVGDDDQSIYRFRGSKPELMLNFPKVYPDCTQILLDINYRSDAKIVEKAKRLIAHNKARFSKDIRADKPAKQEVRVHSYESQREENLAIIRDIRRKASKTGDYSQFAILFRTNTQPRLLSEQLTEYNIPFHMKERIPNLYDHWIAKDILTYIRIARGSRKREDFLQIMNRPSRYIRRDSLCEPEIDLDELIKEYDERGRDSMPILDLSADLEKLKGMSPYAAINYIRRGIGYDDFLKAYADYRDLKEDDLFDILEEMQQIAKNYKSYETWMEHIEEYARSLKQMADKSNENTNAITLATLHSSKGLEFEHVYLLDANEGITPYKKAVLTPDIEEERRLFYVGMTRAKEHLTICYVASINDKSMEPSRFLREMEEK